MFRKNYHRRHKFKNPFFKTYERKRMSFFKKALLFFILIILAAAGIFVSPLLAIKKINIVSKISIPTDQIQTAILKNIPNWQRLPFLKTEPIAALLINKFNFTSAAVTKKFPNALFVKIEERVATALWEFGERTVVIDQTGSILRDAGQEDYANARLTRFEHNITIPEEETSESSPPDILPTIPSFAILQEAEKVMEKLQNNFKIQIASIVFESPDNASVSYRTQEGWKIRIDLSTPTDKQLEKLQPILTKIGDSRKKLQYIDLRFADKVYYK